MATEKNQYRPDYAVPPGWLLDERLKVQRISQAEFARRCGRSPKLISEIVSGKAAIQPDTALQFERVLGVDASIWLGMEANYRLHQARKAEAADDAASIAWARTLPLKELAARGVLRQAKAGRDTHSELLGFFGVGSVEAWEAKYSRANVAYRHSPSFKSDDAALATWLRLGEIDAEGQECADYNASAFKRALGKIRGLTRMPVEEALARSRRLCNRSGVALAVVKPLPGTALSGAAWWPTPKKALILLSARHKSDDHLWFSLFHEAAHVCLHSKKGVFVDDARRGDAGLEAEADSWAANALVPRSAWRRFVGEAPPTRQAVLAFAEGQGIAPGIVVGRLQHEGRLPWKSLNGLKRRYRWRDV